MMSQSINDDSSKNHLERIYQLNHILYTATGCTRCKITKQFIKERGIAYEEFDIKAEGKDAFGRFYRENRHAIVRDKEGVEFPVFTDGDAIRQGLGAVIAYLQAGNRLDGFIGHSDLHQNWISGLNISGGDPTEIDELVSVLSFIKKSGLKLQLDTNGRNAFILEKLLALEIGDRVIMDVKGPAPLYSKILGEEIDWDEIEKSIALVCRFPEYKYFTKVVPVTRGEEDNPEISYLTPEEVGDTARLIEGATGSKKHAFLLRIFDPATCSDAQLNAIEKLPSNALYKYRTAARRFQVQTEIDKI